MPEFPQQKHNSGLSWCEIGNRYNFDNLSIRLDSLRIAEVAVEGLTYYKYTIYYTVTNDSPHEVQEHLFTMHYQKDPEVGVSSSTPAIIDAHTTRTRDHTWLELKDNPFGTLTYGSRDANVSSLGETEKLRWKIQFLNLPTTWNKVGRPYKTSDNLTITLNSFTIEEPSSGPSDQYCRYQINYTVKNENPYETQEGVFSLFRTDEPGYGISLGNQPIKAGKTETRIAVWDGVDRQFGILAYGISEQPKIDYGFDWNQPGMLVWKAPAPKSH